MRKIVICTLVLLSCSLGASTIVPFERDVPRVGRYSFLTSNNHDSLNYMSHFGGDRDETLYWQGFSLTNIGPNEIVTSIPADFDPASREYFFISDDRSRRDTYLWITDYNGSGRISDLFETVLVFLPRIGQMHMEEMADSMKVTLTTGEAISFHLKSKTVLSGVLSEGPVDFNPDRQQRKHAQIAYQGKGIMIRSDARGADPRLAGKVQVLKAELEPCVLPGPLFWTQEGHPKFRFVSDEDAFALIQEKCGPEYLP